MKQGRSAQATEGVVKSRHDLRAQFVQSVCCSSGSNETQNVLLKLVQLIELVHLTFEQPLCLPRVSPSFFFISVVLLACILLPRSIQHRAAQHPHCPNLNLLHLGQAAPSSEGSHRVFVRGRKGEKMKKQVMKVENVGVSYRVAH